MNLSKKIKFHVSGELHTVDPNDVTPETTLNTYLREKAHLTGTKRMCLEGGCGVCVVAVEEVIDNKNTIFAVNSCLVSIFSCHGWKIHTIEGIGSPTTGFHQIQKLLAENNGTQCGFCSPAMVMNMYALQSSGALTQKQIENSFGGSICRCTGYRPILTAFKKLASDADDKIEIENLSLCKKAKNGCPKSCKAMCEVRNEDRLYFESQSSNWFKTYYVRDVLDILSTADSKSYMLVAGNTAKGVFPPTSTPDMYIDISAVDELKGYSLSSDALSLGANMSLTKAMEVFREVASGNERFDYLNQIVKHIDLVANVPVRNIGTLAGNMMIKHSNNDFQSDIFLLLETFKAVLVIVDTDEIEITTSAKYFLKIDMSKKVLKTIILKGLGNTYKYGTYKIMPRSQSAHAHVNAGFLVNLEADTVKSARVVYGAINPEFIHATKTESLMIGKKLYDNKTLQAIFKCLDSELVPEDKPPEPTPEFRKQLAIGLFYKFILSTAPDNLLSARHKTGGSLLERPVSSGTQEFGTDNNNWPLTEPVLKLEALDQTAGVAEYIADIPDLPNQLFGAFVTADAIPNSFISKIDTSEALKIEGVEAFFSAKDIPGENNFMPPSLLNFSIKEELFCSGKVQYYGQAVGIVIAKTHSLALEAAKKVRVTFTAPKEKPYLTMDQVLKDNVTSRIINSQTIVAQRKGTDTKQVIKGVFDLKHQCHFHMELQCCNVVPHENDTLEIQPSSQWMDHAQCAAALALNIPASKIEVKVRRLGGAFGAKITRNGILSTAASIAAYKLKKPVKIWMPLQTNMNMIGKRIPCHVDYEVGVDQDGVIQYLEADIYSDMGIGGNEFIYAFMQPLFENVYDISTWDYSINTVSTDTAANCWTRAPGSLEGLAAIESIMEDIAYTLGKDPYDVRLANMDKENYPKVVEFLNEMETWAQIKERREEVDNFNKANRWKKRGLDVVPMSWVLEVLGNFTVLVSVFHQDGSVMISHGGIEMGQGINTKAAQVAAYKLGVPLDKVSVTSSYSFVGANSMTSGGSFASESVAYGVIQACDGILAKIEPVRQAMGGNPSWESLVKRCYDENVQISDVGYYAADSPGIEAYPIYGVCATEVEIDVLTGQKEIVRVDLIEDVGESMNPLIDVGQCEGAFVMGIGYHTQEQLKFDDDGRLLTNRTWTYYAPLAKDIPQAFNIKFPEGNPNPVGVLRSKAIAEPPICLSCAVPFSMRNAIASARKDSDSSQPGWIPMNGTTTVEHTFLNCLNDYKQYVL